MFRLKRILFVTVFLLTLFSCRKDFKRPNWDTELLAPLLRTSLSLDQLVPDSVIEVNSDQSVRLVYQTDLLGLDAVSILNIPDTAITEVHTFAVSLVANPGNSFYSNDEERSLNVDNGVELNYAIIRSGFMEVEIFSEIQERILITYSIPGATKNGDTLVINDQIDAATATQDGYLKRLVDLSGYEIDLSGVSGAEVNTIVTRASGNVDHTATGPVTISSGDKITFKSTLTGIVPYFVRGYLSNQLIKLGPESVDLNAFNLIKSGTIDLESVDVSLELLNGIGVDGQLILNQFSASNTQTALTTNLSHSIVGSPINLNAASPTGTVPEVNYTSHQTLLNNANSNIDQLLEILPDKINYGLDININPLGNISGSNDFMYVDHSLKALLKVEFPLSLVANNLLLCDTVDVSIRNENETGRIVNGTLFLYVRNGFPFDASVQVDLYNDQLGFLQALTVEGFIQPPLLDNDNRVIEKRESVISIPLSAGDIDNLYNTNQIVLGLSLTTSSTTQFVKVYNDYSMDVDLVGDFTYNTIFK